MTIVEFFDDEMIDNAMGTILLRPDNAVILFDGEKDIYFLSALEKILKRKGINTKVYGESVDTSSLENVRQKINEIIKKFPDCDFDIAGGNDIVLVAVGEAAKEYNLPMHTVDVRKMVVRGVNNDLEYKVFENYLTVEEIIMLQGGKAGKELREKETYTWERNPSAEEDIEKVWDICKSDPGAWNSAIGSMRGYRADKKNILAMIWSKLKKEQLVRKDAGTLKYKNDLVKYLLSKQGTALEMYTYVSAKSAGFFDDGQSGVIIDWKGRREVENEIDVLLTKGAEGYFISCKNGLVDSDELYKLNTVATRFGGRYAKKILVLSAFEPDRSFMERAEELGVKVIKNVRHLSKKDFAKRLIS